MTQTTYLIIAEPHSDRLAAAARQLQHDMAAGHDISQLFFYSAGVAIATLAAYPLAARQLIEAADDHGIALHVCSAGFQKRGYQLSPIAAQDFAFKGLGQFMAETRDVNHIRVF
ncbi:MAG: hypothetical protein CSA45_06705 [Gammaproteobacteria bacterium]|nr:MAG: hypothetical protein CSA45_06705 [Gammaproteobacteria bacterium]